MGSAMIRLYSGIVSPAGNIPAPKEVEEGIYAGYAWVNHARYPAAIFIKNGVLEANLLGYSGAPFTGQELTVEILQGLPESNKLHAKEAVKAYINGLRRHNGMW